MSVLLVEDELIGQACAGAIHDFAVATAHGERIAAF